MYNFRSPKGDFKKVEFGALQESTLGSLLENHAMVNDKKGGNHKLLNNFNGVHVFALQGYDPGSKTLFPLVLIAVLMQVYF